MTVMSLAGCNILTPNTEWRNLHEGGPPGKGDLMFKEDENDLCRECCWKEVGLFSLAHEKRYRTMYVGR